MSEEFDLTPVTGFIHRVIHKSKHVQLIHKIHHNPDCPLVFFKPLTKSPEGMANMRCWAVGTRNLVHNTRLCIECFGRQEIPQGPEWLKIHSYFRELVWSSVVQVYSYIHLTFARVLYLSKLKTLQVMYRPSHTAYASALKLIPTWRASGVLSLCKNNNMTSIYA